MLTIASLLSILLLTLHITDDIVRGISKAEPSNIALAVLVCCCTGRWCSPNGDRVRHHAARRVVRGSHAVIHMRGAHYGEIAKSTGGFFFVWTLWALGGLGGFTFILSARGLWGLRRGSHGSPTTRTWKGPIWRLSAACGRMTRNSDRTAATITRSLIGGMEAIGHEAETALRRKRTTTKSVLRLPDPRARQSRSLK